MAKATSVGQAGNSTGRPDSQSERPACEKKLRKGFTERLAKGFAKGFTELSSRSLRCDTTCHNNVTTLTLCTSDCFLGKPEKPKLRKFIGIIY